MKPSGCVALTYIVIVPPMWYVILFQILKAINTPTWVWGLYWAYAPLAYMLSIATVAFREGEKP